MAQSFFVFKKTRLNRFGSDSFWPGAYDFFKYKACGHAYGVYDIKIGKYEEPFFSLVFVVTGDIIRRGWLSYDLSREVALLIVI